MHFHKFPYPTNFEFLALEPGKKLRTSRGTYKLNVAQGADDVYHLQIIGKGWEANSSDADLRLVRPKKKQSAATRLVFDDSGCLRLEHKEGGVLLSSLPRRAFGQCGAASVFEFQRMAGDQFYGLGEKWSGLEHSGKTTKFWNTDVWGDFNSESYIHGKPAPDPTYVSIPYLIIKRGESWIGLLLDNPRATFISTGFKISIADQMEVVPGGSELAEEIIEATEHPAGTSDEGAANGFIHLGAEEGQPNLYIIYGASLSELTRKFQKLVGVTPLPPAWALGYHQCRWGYQSELDLLTLDEEFRKHGIPADGLWLDIDYMSGYRVFTFAEKNFKDPAATMAELTRRGRKVIPIIDPGVKFEKDYPVYQRGHQAEAFCLNPQGREYIGLVWPGETVFPDFSLKGGRQWWASEVQKFAEHGIYGAWLDMNDPATGPAENQDMLFDRGREPHSSYHNQYALGMAQATREGFLAAHPDERTFLLSRSGFTGSNRYTAIWTGDNYSNYHHLRNSIPTTLNLSLSGIPFNGPDAGGFGGDTTPELIRDWYKAGFLFPVFRNHSLIDTRKQEPWAFDLETLDVLRHYIQLRYRLRPYLYQLFIEHEVNGDAILRPLFYDFKDTKDLPLGLIDDQFLVGSRIMQAPFVRENEQIRDVVLPGKELWFDTSTGQWIDGGCVIQVTADRLKTPLYVRDRSIIPLARVESDDHVFHAERVDFHLFLSSGGEARTRYVFDDGATFAYQRGKRSAVEIIVRREGRSIVIDFDWLEDGFGPGDFTFTTEDSITDVTIAGVPAARTSSQGLAFTSAKMVTWIV